MDGVVGIFAKEVSQINDIHPTPLLQRWSNAAKHKRKSGKPDSSQLQELVHFAETRFYVRFTKLIGVGLLASPPE